MAQCIIWLMNQHSSRLLQDKRHQLQEAEGELHQLNLQLQSFEDVVDAQLGELLDQLSELNAETATLSEQLKRIRDERLYGKERIKYLEGAPVPGKPVRLEDLSPIGLSRRAAIHTKAEGSDIPDLKTLYRKLARRYHPDLARDEAGRSAANEQMAQINQAYAGGDLKALLSLAGIGIPYGMQLPEAEQGRNGRRTPLSELEQLERKLKAVQEQIRRMSNLPIVKLSLEVKLAQHQGRNLLREMVSELEYKVGRKMAERDYLQAQIRAHSEG